MLKSQQEYEFTKVQLEKFQNRLQEIDGSSETVRQIEADAIRSTIDELKEELQEWEQKNFT